MVDSLTNGVTFRRVLHKIRRCPAGLVRRLARVRQVWRNPDPVHGQLCEKAAQIVQLLGDGQVSNLPALLERQAEMLRLTTVQQQNPGVSPLDLLRVVYPWPQRRPDLPACNHTWHNNGRELINRLIADRGVKLILEIGTFLGHSALRWLDAAGPGSTVICIDPFLPDLNVAQWGWNDLAGKNLYYAFLANCWQQRQQIIPIRGSSPRALEPVHFLGVHPDLIYIDGSHYYQDVLKDLEHCHRYWPHAILCGDDWRCDKERLPPASVQEAVQDFARANHFHINVDWNTWALTENPLK